MDREEIESPNEIEELNLVYSQSRCTPWDLEKIGQRIRGSEKAEIQINELGEGIKKLHFRTEEGKIEIFFETEWKFVAPSRLPQPKNCIKIFKKGKINPRKIKSIIRKLTALFKL